MPELEATQVPLNKCPFCGSDNTDAEFAKTSSGLVAAGCMDCGASGPEGQNAEDAIYRWNGRSAAAAEQISATALN